MIDRRSFGKDLKDMRKRCIEISNYNPEDDIVFLITKYNLDCDFIWKKIKKMLTM